MGAEGDGAGQGVFGEVVQGGIDILRLRRVEQHLVAGVAAAGAAEFVEVGGEGLVHQGAVVAGDAGCQRVSSRVRRGEGKGIEKT